MTKATPIKYSFNAGELSPLLDGRTDQAKYYSGASICENFIPTVQGPIIRRGGTYFTNEVKDSADRSWLRRFIFNVNQSYILEFGDGYVRFYTDRGAVLAGSPDAYDNAKSYTPGGLVSSGGVNYYCILATTGHAPPDSARWYAMPGSGEYEVPSPYAASDLTDSDGNFRLNFRQSGDVLYITHNSNLHKSQKLSRLGALDWTIADVSLSNGPFKIVNTDKTVTVYASAETGSGITLTASNSLFQSGHVGSLFYLGQQPSDTLKAWEPGKNIFSGEIRRSGVNYYQAETISGTATVSGASAAAACVITATAHGFTTGDFVFITGIAGMIELNDQWYYVKKVNANAFYIMDDEDPATYTNSSGYTAYSSGGTAQKGKRTGGVTPVHTEGGRTDGDPGVNWTYLHSGFGIAKITNCPGSTSASVTADVISRVPAGCVGSGNPTYLWAHSLFSDVEGWPELVGLFRERLSFVKGLSLAMSVSADYENFASKIGGVVTADAAINITLPDTNPSRWMLDGNDLLVGTGGRELAVGKVATSDPLGPANIEARKQTVYGSRAVEPVEVGNSVLFVTRSGQKLREIVFDWTRNGYVSSDLTVLSEHIARAGLSQICYQQEPYSIVWGCTAAGELVGFTFNREQDVLAWHRHPIGGSGFVESVQSIPSPDGRRDDLWLIVKRTINGVTRRYVEYMMPEFDGDDSTIADAFYVDAGLTYTGASTATITGLDHLKGATVDVLAHGGQHRQVTVSNSGTVTLDYAVTKAQVGLPCPCRIRTMRTEAGSQLGTAQGKIKRITRLLLRLLKTLGGKYGPDDDHLDELQYRAADAAMDTPPAMASGDKTLPFPAGFDTDGYVLVYNDVPLPMTIVSIVTDLVTNES